MCANGSYTIEATQDKTTNVLHTSSYKWMLSVACFIFLRRRYSLSRVQRKRCWWALGEWISNDQTRTYVRKPVSIYSFSILDSSRAWDLLFRDYFILDFGPAVCWNLAQFNTILKPSQCEGYQHKVFAPQGFNWI